MSDKEIEIHTDKRRTEHINIYTKIHRILTTSQYTLILKKMEVGQLLIQHQVKKKQHIFIVS